MSNRNVTEILQERIGAHIEESQYVRMLAIGKAPYLDAYIRGETAPPFEIEIQPSSRCNLKCRWCIGEELQAQNRVLNLPNAINADNIGQIVEGILETRKNGLGVEIVKFSGFIGEPLVRKEAVLPAILRLAGAGVRVGLFTNGVLMTEETWEALAHATYVNLSLDAGPRTFSVCKENSAPENPHPADTFHRIMNNLRGLDRQRKKTGRCSEMNITVGYIIINENCDEIYETTRIVREAGADAIRFKFDIGGQFDLRQAGMLQEAFSQIEQAQADFHNPPAFSVMAIHSRQDAENGSFADWNCSNGCHYQYFCTTIGSDGNVYLCDHNTMPGAIPFGNAINQPFGEIWDGKLRHYLVGGTQYLCKSSVCPPFGRKVNAFLSEIVELRGKYGAEAVITALELLRNKEKN